MKSKAAKPAKERKQKHINGGQSEIIEEIMTKKESKKRSNTDNDPIEVSLEGNKKNELDASDIAPKKKKPKQEKHDSSETLGLNHEYITQLENNMIGSKEQELLEIAERKRIKREKRTLRRMNPKDHVGECDKATEYKESAQKQDKKQVKKKKKKSKKPNTAVADGEADAGKVKGNNAIEYLKLWKEDRKHWAFRTVSQVWLLQNIYSANLISDDIFPTLLEYLEGLKGQGRDLTVKQAHKVIEEDTDEVKLDRAKQVLQMLT